MHTQPRTSTHITNTRMVRVSQMVVTSLHSTDHLIFLLQRRHAKNHNTDLETFQIDIILQYTFLMPSLRVYKLKGSDSQSSNSKARPELSLIFSSPCVLERCPLRYFFGWPGARKQSVGPWIDTFSLHLVVQASKRPFCFRPLNSWRPTPTTWTISNNLQLLSSFFQPKGRQLMAGQSSHIPFWHAVLLNNKQLLEILQ